MNQKIVIVSLVATLCTWNAMSQNPSSGSSETSENKRGASETDNQSGTLPPEVQNRDSLPPGLEKRDQLPPGLAGRTNDLSPTGSQTIRPGTGTNSLSGTNSSVSGTRYQTRTSTNVLRSATQIQDQPPTTPQDRALLTTIRQKVSTEISSASSSGSSSGPTVATTSSNGSIPVRFVVSSGVVELLGSVPTVAEKQRIETIVQRVPGVVSVENNLQVATELSSTETTPPQIFSGEGAQASLSATNSAGFTSTNRLWQTSRGTNASSRNYGTTTNQINGGSENLPATGRTNENGRIFDLPPGLEKRDTLPPGLQNRDQLPPGLNRGTNSAGSNP